MEYIDTIIAALALLVSAWNVFGIRQVHKLTNSMSDKLQKQAGEIGESKGRSDQRKEDENKENTK